VSAGLTLPSTFALDVRLLAVIGLHALARRFGRGADRGNLAVIRDLLPIIPAVPGILREASIRREAHNFEVSCPAGGRWIGSVKVIDARPTLVIRTYVA
jgi:hypothetical protein